MSPLDQDILNSMGQRRAAGERVSALAEELGVPWQRLEKLTRHACRPLPGDAESLKRELRQTRLLLAAVPDLGCDKPWAKAWRERIRTRLRSRVAQLRRRLALLGHEDQVPEKAPRLWRLRPSTAADARIRQRYNPKDTPSMWGDA